MEIIPDPIASLWLTVPFVVTFLGMYVILFRPLLEYLAEREQVVVVAEREAVDFRAKVEDKLSVLETQLESARASAAEVRAEARAEAHVREEAILDKARAEADEKVQAAVSEINENKAAAAKTLEGTARALSQDIAQTIIGREISA